MTPSAKKWIKNLLRWSIAVFGIYYVVSNMSLHNRVMIANPATGWPISVRLAAPATEQSDTFSVYLPDNPNPVTVDRGQVLVKVEPAKFTARHDGGESQFDQFALKVGPEADRRHWVVIGAPPRNIWQRYWNQQRGSVEQIRPKAEIIGPRPDLGVPYPIIEQGIIPMIAQARGWFLVGAILIFPLCFIITSFRWYALLKALEIRMSLARAFVLNMVGAFYNTFMPGSTGGDVLKAYYASRLTPHRTRAVMSIIDRVIGLLALVLLGGTMAAYQYFSSTNASDPATRKCGQIALGSAGIIGVTLIGVAVFYVPLLRRVTLLDWLIKRLPMQRHVQHAVDSMEMYGRHPGLILVALLVTLPVHATVVVSAMLSGMAFNLPLHPLYYWVVVPVVVLSGSIPISPQGAGVMEFFAILLTKRQGCTVSQAFALTMSIRVVQILWNLTGGLFVLRGGFHLPSESEQHTMDEDLPENGSAQSSLGQCSPGE